MDCRRETNKLKDGDEQKKEAKTCTFRPNLVLKDVHVSPVLSNGISGQIELKGKSTDLVVDVPCHRFHLHDVCVCGTNLKMKRNYIVKLGFNSRGQAKNVN